MKYLLILVFLVGCAPGRGVELPDKRAPIESCVDQSFPNDMASVTFTDGSVHKTYISSCSNGCVKYTDINDSSKSVEECGL